MKVKFKKVKVRVKDKDTANTKAMLRIYQEALDRIKGPATLATVGEGALSDLKVHAEELVATQSIMATAWAWWNHAPTEIFNAVALELEPELPSDLGRAYSRELK